MSNKFKELKDTISILEGFQCYPKEKLSQKEGVILEFDGDK